MHGDVLDFVRSAASKQYLPAYREPWTDTVQGRRYLVATDGTMLRWCELQAGEVEDRPGPVPAWAQYLTMPELGGIAVFSMDRVVEWACSWMRDPDASVLIRGNQMTMTGRRADKAGGVETDRGSTSTSVWIRGARMLEFVRFGLLHGVPRFSVRALDAWNTQTPGPRTTSAPAPARPIQLRFIDGSDELFNIGNVVSQLTVKKGE